MKEQEERVANFPNLVREIHSLMPEWKLKPQGEGSGCRLFTYDSRWCLELDGMQISLTLDYQTKKRIQVQTWAWPSYSYTERGEQRSKRVCPHDLYPIQEFSDITIAVDRGAESIVKEIKRRLLPDYMRVYALCLERATSLSKQYKRQDEDWAAICAAIGKSKNHNTHYVSIGGDRNVVIENRSGKAHISLDVTSQQLVEILAVLKDEEIEILGGTKRKGIDAIHTSKVHQREIP